MEPPIDASSRSSTRGSSPRVTISLYQVSRQHFLLSSFPKHTHMSTVFLISDFSCPRSPTPGSRLSMRGSMRQGNFDLFNRPTEDHERLQTPLRSKRETTGSPLQVLPLRVCATASPTPDVSVPRRPDRRPCNCIITRTKYPFPSLSPLTWSGKQGQQQTDILSSFFSSSRQALE